MFSFLYSFSAVERRSGVTGVLTWPWCCPTSHTPWTWILAQSPLWVTLLVGLNQKAVSHCTELRRVFILHPNKLAASHFVCLHLFCVVAASKGLIDAAHFCYLMAQVGLGFFTKKSTKMVLIGSNHRLETQAGTHSYKGPF